MIPGIVVAWAGREDRIPNEWRHCDGRSMWSTAFPTAGQALGELWDRHQPDGFFKLPDLRGYFLRGVDEDGTVDLGLSERENWEGNSKSPWVGTKQLNEVQSHIHPARWLVEHGGYRTGQTDATGHAGIHGIRADETDASDGVETRPVNMAVYWIIYIGSQTFRVKDSDPEIAWTGGEYGQFSVVEILPGDVWVTTDGKKWTPENRDLA